MPVLEVGTKTPAAAGPRGGRVLSARIADLADPDEFKDTLRGTMGLGNPTSNGNGVHHQADDVAECWHRRADELADWTERRAVNRRDISGGYYLNTDGKVSVTTSHDKLTLARIIRHYKATSISDVLGLHTTALIIWDEGKASIDQPRIESCLSLWGGGDIDQHGDADSSQANEAAAIAWYGVLVGLGFHPLLTDSNGKGGFHLRVFLEDSTITANVRQLFRWLMRDWKERGLDGEPEIFPKQNLIAREGPGSCGNWLRLPGRHPKRDHWSRVWDGAEWLDEDDAIDFIVNLTGDPAQLIPNEALSFDPEEGRKTSSRSGDPATADDIGFAREALKHLGPGKKDPRGREFLTDYSSWLVVGMSLYDLGGAGLDLWEGWSRQSSKYEADGDNSCAEKWETFKAAGSQGVTLGTLFHHAKASGWPGFPVGPATEWPAQGAGSVNEAADDPHRLARLHLAKYQREGGPMLRCYRGEWLGWSNGAYRAIGEPELQAGLTGTIKAEFDRLNQMAIEMWEKADAKNEG
jgi:putative DNA primase/helicase